MTRKVFHSFLEDLIGSKNVYYQPPSKFKMSYPCIRYEPADIDVGHADNFGYRIDRAYSVTFISQTEDLRVVRQLAAFPRSRHTSSYRASGLYHEVFLIYP